MILLELIATNQPPVKKRCLSLKRLNPLPKKLLIERNQDVWTHSAKHGRVHQVSLETSFLVINLSRKSYGPGKWKQIQEKMEIKEVIKMIKKKENKVICYKIFYYILLVQNAWQKYEFLQIQMIFESAERPF